MKWVIKTTLLKTGNSYYFVRLQTVDGVIRPVNCLLSRVDRGGVAVFPSIAAACSVIRQINQADWRCRIRPAKRVFWGR